LNTYVADSRTALDSKTRSDAVVTMVCTFGAGVGTGALTEAGIFDVVTQDTVNMWCYATFDVINKAAGDSLVITWTLTYA
jgi:Mg2+/citrate symporter